MKTMEIVPGGFRDANHEMACSPLLLRDAFPQHVGPHDGGGVAWCSILLMSRVHRAMQVAPQGVAAIFRKNDLHWAPKDACTSVELPDPHVGRGPHCDTVQDLFPVDSLSLKD